MNESYRNCLGYSLRRQPKYYEICCEWLIGLSCLSIKPVGIGKKSDKSNCFQLIDIDGFSNLF